MTTQRFKLSQQDWDKLHRLSKDARNAPVMLVGDVCVSASAHDDVQSFWGELAKRYGFKKLTVCRDYPETREIEAELADDSEEEAAMGPDLGGRPGKMGTLARLKDQSVNRDHRRRGGKA